MSRLKVLVSLVLIPMMVSCASTTVIKSIPSGAKVYADGQYLGKTPYTYSDTKIVGATTHLQFKKKGCETLTAVMTRSEKFEIGPCIGGVFVLVPFLWVMGYNPSHTYEMECESSASFREKKSPFFLAENHASMVSSCAVPSWL